MVGEPGEGEALVLSEEEALEIINFLLCSAEICLHEPIYYGTFRLLDGVSRLIGYLLDHDPPRTGAFLRELKAEIDANKTAMMWDRPAYYEFLRRLPTKSSAALKRLREPDTTPGSPS